MDPIQNSDKQSVQQNAAASNQITGAEANSTSATEPQLEIKPTTESGPKTLSSLKPSNMQDFVGKYREVGSWSLPGSVVEARQSLTPFIKKIRGKIIFDNNLEIRLELGSRLIFRLFGVLTPNKYVPALLNIKVEQIDASNYKITAEVLSNTGKYVWDITSLTSPVYSKKFTWVFTKLKEVMPNLIYIG